VHLNRVDLNLLVVFNAIYSEGGITRASEKLNLTQPAISHALGRLRQLFDDPLFVREGRAMVPTPMARNLVVPVQRALRGLEVMFSEIDRFDPASTQRQFTLGVRDVLESTLLPPLLQRVMAEAPEVDVAAVRTARRDIEGELANGTLDLAIDVLLPVGERIRRQPIETDRMVVLARADHPRIGKTLSLDEYLRQSHVLVSSRRSGGGLEDIELARLGLRRRIRLRCQHYFAACRVVSQTNLLLTMPERYALIVNEQFGNRVLPLPLEGPTLDIFLYWHENVDNDPANHWLREQVLSLLATDV
jgi:DNA-binding transcriptional LysR family regulator